VLGSRLVNAVARRLMGLPAGLYLSSFKCLSRFAVGHVLPALALSGALTLLALFGVGLVKARVAGVSAVRSGLEVAALAAALLGVSLG
jgi:hypothetical protein